jgi:hypothetical protein
MLPVIHPLPIFQPAFTEKKIVARHNSGKADFANKLMRNFRQLR